MASTMFVIGRNDDGEFGLGHTNSILQLTQHNNNKHDIKYIACGNGYNIYIDNNNDFFSSGYNRYGSCCINNNEYELIETLTEINYFKINDIKIKKVCASICGWVTLWITDKNKLYVNGVNYNNQLGIGHETIGNYKPILIKNLHNVIDAVSSENYSIALCSININMIINHWLRINKIIHIIFSNDIIDLIDFYGNTNEVYTTMNGHGKWKKIEKFNNKKIIKIATGKEHSLFLQSNGIVWCWGNNESGQLGLGYTNNTKYDKPKEIKYFIEHNIKVKDICCGSDHNLAIDCKNKVYSWGENLFGQCGNNTTTDINVPQIIIALKNCEIKIIKCASWNSYVYTKNGNHYLFGDNGYRQCIKQNNNENLLLPCLINKEINNKSNGKIVKGVYLGIKSSIFLFEKG